jgi:hypothetical protein
LIRGFVSRPPWHSHFCQNILPLATTYVLNFFCNLSCI